MKSCIVAVMLWSVLLIFGTLTSVAGYKNGKVERSCDHMTPEHGGQANVSSSPYTITTNSSTFRPGDHIHVTLSGSQHFEGFLIEARAAAAPVSLALGTFSLLSPDISQLLQCNNIERSAVSHTSNGKKSEVGVIWNAPSDAPPTVNFLATVVAHYSKFWVKIPSPVITLSGVTTQPPQNTTTTTTQNTPTTTLLPQSFSSDGCGWSKSCLLDPPGCNPATEKECFFLSYRTEGRDVEFELSGPAQGYVSLALSDDKWMGNDDVYLCVNDAGRVDVEVAFTSGRSHPEISPEAVLSDVGWRVWDGVIQCRFRRAIKVQSDGQRFNLNQSHYIFLAHGAAQQGMIHKHKRQPLISTHRQVITGPPEILTGSRSPLIIKCHGSLMLLAWMIAGCTGTFIAGFFKPDWPEKTLFGQRIWFQTLLTKVTMRSGFSAQMGKNVQLHRGLMILTVILTVVSFAFPFSYRGHWSRDSSAHAILGCFVLAFTVVQPVMAFCRPAPESSRWIFNWLHWAVGNIAEIFAVTAMLVGVRQPSLLLPFPWTTGVLSAFLIWVAFSKIVLVLFKKGIFEKGRNSTDETLILISVVKRNWGTRIKVAILTVYVVGNSALCISLLCSISQI